MFTLTDATLNGPLIVTGLNTVVNMSGERSILRPDNNHAIVVNGGTLMVTGTGSLAVNSLSYALYGEEGITITETTITASCPNSAPI